MPSSRTVAVGTRGSGLAMRQTSEVLRRLQAAYPEVRFQVTTVATGGDVRPEEPVVSIGAGAFTKELQTALLCAEIDVAVHSLKDLPTGATPGVEIGAITKRLDPRDVLVDRWDLPLQELPQRARIGTGSPRRASQLLLLRPDLRVLHIRGNVDTRLKKARGPDYDGVVLAMAGLIRLERQAEVAEVFDPHVMLPAPGQGALALEMRQGDEELAALLGIIHDKDTAAAVWAERALLSLLGGGCHLPLGAYASVEGDVLTLSGVLASESGTQAFKAMATGGAQDPQGVAKEVHRQLMEQGAFAVLTPLEGAR